MEDAVPQESARDRGTWREAMASACLACVVVQPARASHQQARPKPCADVQVAQATGPLCCN